MYVGKTNNISNRKYQHLKRNGTGYSAVPIDVDIQYVDFVVDREFENNVDAVKYENELILKYDTINNGWNKNRSGYICEDMKTYYKERNQKPERKEWVRKYVKSDKYKEWLDSDSYKECRKRFNEKRRKQRLTPEKKRILKAKQHTKELLLRHTKLNPIL